MSMGKLVSVVIPTYNTRRYVAEAVESALAQTYRPLEVLVVDDGSTDGTDVEMRRFGDPVRYLVQQNRGPAAARNLGIREARGEYVAFLDADDLWDPVKITKQVAVMERSPEVGVVYCGIQRVDLQAGTTVTIVRDDPTLRGDIRRKLLQRNRVVTSTLLIRRACFELEEGFDETLRWAEDWDLWIRISRHFHFDAVTEPLVIYRVHGGNVSKKVAAMHQSQLQVIRRAYADDPFDGRNALLRRRSTAYVHFDAGDEYLQAGEFGRARHFLLRAVANWPFELRYAVFLLRALLRKPVVETASPAMAETELVEVAAAK